MLVVYAVVILASWAVYSTHASSHIQHDQLYLNASIISGETSYCKHTTEYFVNPTIKFKFCVAHNDEYIKLGNSIVDLVRVRGYLPTCRVLQLLMWMHRETEEVNNQGSGSHPLHTIYPHREHVVDVGANIGSCTFHMAALGAVVTSFEPVQDHITIMRGTMQMNPAFQVQLHQGGVSDEDSVIHGKFQRENENNWGGTVIVEDKNNKESINMFSLRRVINHKRITLLKIDCEGCEYVTLKGAMPYLKHISMIKLELTLDQYTNHTTPATAFDILKLLEAHNFDLYVDQWNEMHLYHGRDGNKIMPSDYLFGSARFNLPTDMSKLHEGAVSILKDEVHSATFDYNAFKHRAMDVIAIEKKLSQKMKKKWLNQS